MYTLRCVLAGLAAWLMLGPLALAVDAQEQPRERPGADVRRPLEGFPVPGLERLELTDVQKAKLAQLQKELQEKLQAAEKKHREAIEQARQNQDREKAQEATQAFRKETEELQGKFREQVQQVLTDEQKRRLAELQRDRPPEGRPGLDLLPRLLEQLELTAEQREKIAKVMQESQEKQEAAAKKLREGIEQARQNQDREKARDLIQAHEKESAQLREKMLEQVQAQLSEQQKRRFVELQRRRPEGDVRPGGPGIGQLVPPPVQERLGLTPEQREKLAKLQKETEAKLREILNEEQNRKFEELKRGGAPPERPRPPD